jgi:hypothetical protein
MSVDNNHFDNREIQALRQEQPRPDAKGELILALLKPKRESKMSILRKATLPTLVSVAAIAGVFFVAQPRVVAATPERVIKAIQDIKNYTINSFTIEGNARHLQSETTVNGKDRNTVYYDKNGAVTKSQVNESVMMMNDSPMKMGFVIDATGNLKDMSKADIEKMKGSIHFVRSGDANGLTLHSGKGENNVKIEVTKGPDGKEVKHIFVNGKEVDKLPAGMESQVKVLGGGLSGGGKSNIRVEVTKGPDGKEVKHFFVDGKEVDKLPGGIDVVVGSGKLTNGQQEVKIHVTKDANGKDVKHFIVNGKEVDKLPDGMEAHAGALFSTDGVKSHEGGGMVMLNAESTNNGKESVSKSMAVVGGKKGEKPMIMQSGQTSADYLISLLKDTARWTIERGVNLNGQRLDKFTLKGPISPIELFIDPATALPKVLRFGTPMQEGVIIEDVYEYGNQPQ